MSLEEKDFELIEQFLRNNLPRIISDQGYSRPPVVYEIELRERMVRVDEELKNQRELMIKGFDMMEKRFEQVDKRFEEMREDFNKRFEQVDKRFEQVDKRFEQVDKRFEDMRQDFNKRFEQIDKRFEQVDKRFEQVEKRLDDLSNRMFQFMIWSFGLTVSAAGIIIAVMKLS